MAMPPTEADRVANGPSEPWWRRAEVAVGAVAVICFINVLPNDFCYDDDPIVRLNPKVNDPGQWLAIWTTDHWSETRDTTPNRDLLYRPVSVSSYRLVRIVGGKNPLPHHLVNMVLHALVSVLVVRLCRHMGGRERQTSCLPYPLLAGVVFAVLPIHTEAVAAVVGRADLLATLGVLLTLQAHRRSMQATTRSRAYGWQAAAALAAFGAMGSKETGVTVVALAVLLDEFWGRAAVGSRRGREIEISHQHWGHTLRTRATRLAYLLIPLALYLGLRYHALGGQLYQQPAVSKTVNVLVDAPSWQHVLGVFQLWGMYWAKSVWPAVLSVKYSVNGIRLATSPMDPDVLIGAFVTVGLAVTSVVAWRRKVRSVAFLTAAIAVSYLPTANALVLIQVFFAERIWYLPSVWLAILAALAATAVLRRRTWWVMFAVLTLGMTLRCWIRNADWRDSGTLYAAAYHDQPGAIGPLHLYGQWLVNHGRYKRGVELLNDAIDIDLGFTDAHRTLGHAHLRAGDLEAGLRHLQIAYMQVPGHPPTVAGLARVSRELSERDEELKHLKQRAADNAGDVEAHIALVRRLRELGLVRDALARLRQGERQFTESATWQAEYAVTLVYLNERDRAIERYRKCLELDPLDAQRAVELAMLLVERREEGDLDDAWAWAMHASSLAPGASSVLACQAELLALRGDLATALALYEQAIRALPPDNDQRRVFEQRARALGR